MHRPDGKIAGKYTQGKRLGAGAFGEVYAGNVRQRENVVGINSETMQEVAIKTVTNSLFNRIS